MNPMVTKVLCAVAVALAVPVAGAAGRCIADWIRSRWRVRASSAV